MIVMLSFSILLSISVLLFLIDEKIIKTIKQNIVSLIGIELILAIIVYRLYSLYDVTYYFVMLVLTIVFLLISSIKDIKERIISIHYIVITGLLAIGMIFVNPNVNIIESGFGLLIGVGLILLSVVTNNAIGQGDALVIAVLGVLLGYKMTIAILLIALILSAFVSGYIIFIKKKSRKTAIPFVPFLLCAALTIFLI